MAQLKSGFSVKTPDWYILCEFEPETANSLTFFLDPGATAGLPYQNFGYYSLEVFETAVFLGYWLQVAWGEIRPDGFILGTLPGSLFPNARYRLRGRFFKDKMNWVAGLE